VQVQLSLGMKSASYTSLAQEPPAQEMEEALPPPPQEAAPVSPAAKKTDD
jgi:hypothetical protein